MKIYVSNIPFQVFSRNMHFYFTGCPRKFVFSHKLSVHCPGETEETQTLCWCEEHAACMGRLTNAYRVFVGRLNEKHLNVVGVDVRMILVWLKTGICFITSEQRNTRKFRNIIENASEK
jgi:hypothetical protein